MQNSFVYEIYVLMKRVWIQTFSDYIGGLRQSASFVLLWLPCSCINLFGWLHFFVLFSENKYDKNYLFRMNFI